MVALEVCESKEMKKLKAQLNLRLEFWEKTILKFGMQTYSTGGEENLHSKNSIYMKLLFFFLGNIGTCTMAWCGTLPSWTGW